MGGECIALPQSQKPHPLWTQVACVDFRGDPAGKVLAQLHLGMIQSMKSISNKDLLAVTSLSPAFTLM